MKKSILIFLICGLWSFGILAQDTFSIVAVDEETGEVGSAGASCVDLSNFGLPPDFLGVLVPGQGAINTQAYYLGDNQTNATNQMLAGKSPQEIIDWLVDNDVQNNPSLRQYGVVRIIDGMPFSAAHTGANTDAYTGHRLGPNYAIQGNILLGPEILDSMEQRFLNTEGTLADKLMAAMQGANVVGADTRCAGNGTSSLFAFLKVSQTNDSFGSPSLVLGVDFPNNSGMEPIDSLQILFNEAFPPVSTSELLNVTTSIFPNPASEYVVFDIKNDTGLNDLELNIFNASGKHVYSTAINTNRLQIRRADLGESGLFLYQLKSQSTAAFKSGKIIFL